MVELGSGMLIAGFEEQLEGATAGETRTVHIDFPDVDSPKDHRAEDVAGSRASFEVKVKEVLAKRLPELDDALAQQAAGFDTLDELRADIAAELLRRRRGARRRGVRRDGARRGRDRGRDRPARARSSPPAPARSGRARCARWTSTASPRTSTCRSPARPRSRRSPSCARGRPRELRREAVVAAIAAAEGIVVGDDELRAGEPPPDPADGPAAPPKSRVRRREELLRERVLDLLAREAVAISIEDAQARGKPWPLRPRAGRARAAASPSFRRRATRGALRLAAPRARRSLLAAAGGRRLRAHRPGRPAGPRRAGGWRAAPARGA